jgi:beta-glucosidase
VIAARIEPWLCHDLGSWTNRDCAGWFADYAALIARRFGDRAECFATFNEPSVFSLLDYCIGGQAPGRIP